MTDILTAIGVVTIIGIICAAILAIASKLMAVKVDERIPLVRDCLPGANCGGCGYPGCDGYAAAIVADESIPLTLCTPGGNETAAAIGKVLGREAGEVIEKIAYVHCLGHCGVTEKKAVYQGDHTCVAAKLLFSGDGACAYGCLGYGDCARVCTNDAIYIRNGLAFVDTKTCGGCGQCVRACPQHLNSLRQEATMPVVVGCSNHYKGAVVKKICSLGCIGCSLCSKKCPNNAITMVDDLPVIDFEKCDGCMTCVSVCPTKCILPRDDEKYQQMLVRVEEEKKQKELAKQRDAEAAQAAASAAAPAPADAPIATPAPAAAPATPV